jgi:hypothetical protein
MLRLGSLEIDNSHIDIPLGGYIAKLDRAKEHLQQLDREIARFFDTSPYRALGKVENDGRWYVFRVEVVEEPPARLGVLLGEFAHQVRSTLDQLVYGVMAWNIRPNKPPARTGFPIATTEGEFERKTANRRWPLLPDEWQALIKAMQPYHASERGGDPHAIDLAIIERIWNRDKHQTHFGIPVMQRTGPHQPTFTPVRDAEIVGEPHLRTGFALVDDAEIARVPISATGPDPHVDMEAFLSVEIMLNGRWFMRALPRAWLLAYMLLASFGRVVVPPLPDPELAHWVPIRST